jgi:AraC-like DNA-binding protein
MLSWQAGMTAMAVGVALASLGVQLGRRRKSDADVLFAVVSGSMALSLMAPWLGDAPGWLKWGVAIGGSATCNGYWLVARGLFRGEGGVRQVHVSVAAGVAVLIAAYRGSGLAGGAADSPALLALGGLLTLASSILLGLTFLEALRGWSRLWPAAERRMRLAFLGLFATTVLSTTLLGSLASAWPGLAGLRTGVVALASMAMLVFTHLAFRHRRRWPWLPAKARPAPAAPPAPGSEDARLAEALRQQLEVRQVFREPELKVADLALRLGTTEHRLSRLIGQSLGEKNFNQLINRYRVAHACRLLEARGEARTILEISGDCGFASLGPFNRAFKAAMGCTPRAYRAGRRGQRDGLGQAGPGIPTR